MIHAIAGGASYVLVANTSSAMEVVTFKTMEELAEHAIGVVLARAWAQGSIAANDKPDDVHAQAARAAQLQAATGLQGAIAKALESWEGEDV